MTNNITCINYFRRYFRHSKLIGCTTGVFPSPLSIHVSYGEASILLEIWKRGKSCSWSWPHQLTIRLTTELHGGSFVRKHLRWRLSCKYRWCCIDVISERKKWGFFFRVQCMKINKWWRKPTGTPSSRVSLTEILWEFAWRYICNEQRQN